MPIAFDDAAANALIASAGFAASTLRGQATGRRAAGEHAAQDFAGGFARLFTAACVVESEDRGKLAGVLDDLVEQVREAKVKAQQEKERLEQVAAWRMRQTLRQQTDLSSLLFSSSPPGSVQNFVLYDPGPSQVPVAPPVISAPFSARERTRVAGGVFLGGRTSADPVALRAFVAQSRGYNTNMSAKIDSVSRAWAGFSSSCSWVPMETVNFVGGFRRMLEENNNDATWVENIATAFEVAGSGGLENFDLALVALADQPNALQNLVLSGLLNPSQIAGVWEALVANKHFSADRFIKSHSFELASLDGLPFSVMSQAGQHGLDFALDDSKPHQLQEAFTRMGFLAGEMKLDAFRADLVALRNALERAQDLGRSGDTVQLVSFGRHDGAVTAGISMGNLDQATTIGVFISGMRSNVRGISDAFDAFVKIRAGDTDMAMVTWVGYRAPSIPEEPFQDRADAGGIKLASFLDGIAAQRVGNPIDRLVGLGHSYGTNVLAEALKSTTASVDVYATMGSAGLRYGTTAKDLGVDEIYATHAQGDNLAQTGRHAHIRKHSEDGGGIYRARVDPRDLDDTQVFSSEETADGDAVTMHNLVDPISWPTGTQWLADWFDGTAAADEVGYLNPKSSTVAGLDRIMRRVSLNPISRVTDEIIDFSEQHVESKRNER